MSLLRGGPAVSNISWQGRKNTPAGDQVMYEHTSKLLIVPKARVNP